MSLWNIIRNWFVTNIWGGYYYDEINNRIAVDRRCLVYGFGVGNINEHGFYTSDYKILGDITMGDWLSTTSTILVLIAVCVGLFFLTRYFFRLFAGLISGR